MTFILEIDITGPGMDSWDQIRRALHLIKREVNGPLMVPQEPEIGERGDIRTAQGRKVGRWEVVDD